MTAERPDDCGCGHAECPGQWTGDGCPLPPTAEQQGSDESGGGLTTCPGRIPVEHTIGTLPDDCDVCAPAHARVQAALATARREVEEMRDTLDAAHEAVAILSGVRDDLRAGVAAVGALADEWDERARRRGDTGPDTAAHAASELRAALANPSAAQGGAS